MPRLLMPTKKKKDCFLTLEVSIIVSFLVYEAGKGIKTGASTPQTPAYPPYFVSGLPAMIPIAPPSLVDKVSTVSPSDGTLVAAGEVLPLSFLPMRNRLLV